MDGVRWLITMALGLAPVLVGMGMRPTATSVSSAVSAPQAKVTNPHGPIICPVLELPFLYELETDPFKSGIQSRPNWLSFARHAREGGLYLVPYQPGVQER